MFRPVAVLAGAISLAFVAAFLYIDRDLAEQILPADFECLSREDGAFSKKELVVKNIYGVGLSYAKHINETASNFDPKSAPPIFRKARLSLLNGGGNVAMPSITELANKTDILEPGLNQKLQEQQIELSVLMDYEAELAFVLLDDVTEDDLLDKNFSPRVGYFVANDLSARSIAILGEGQSNRYDYWGLSKSFLGFTPISTDVWIPFSTNPNAIPCVTLLTDVNGEILQRESTSNLIYRPIDMLKFIKQKYPSDDFSKGNVILTGTPGGVTLSTPRWKARMADLLGFNRFQKLKTVQASAMAKRFMKIGDEITVSAEWLGGVSVTID